MRYLLDSANEADIADLIDRFPIEGVTTNPTILSKETGSFETLVRRIRQLIGEDRSLHLQVSCDTLEGLIEEAVALRNLGGENTFIKVPVTPVGIQAIMTLKKKGIGITATAVFTQQQALIAARAGADFVAPYVNRLDNIASNGAAVVGDIVWLFDRYGLSTQVLAASFKNVEQVHGVSMVGAHYATIAPALFPQLVYHPLTDISVDGFRKDSPPCPRWSADMDAAPLS